MGPYLIFLANKLYNQYEIQKDSTLELNFV